MSFLKRLLRWFYADKTTYSHRKRSIELIAQEKSIDLESIKAETKVMVETKGRVEAIHYLTHRFHVPVSVAWGFVDKLDHE